MVPQQNTVFLILAPAAALASLLVGVFSWSQRQNKGALTFALFMWSACGWLLCDTFEILSDTPQATLFWAKLSFIFVSTVPVTWFIFINQFYGKGHWFNLLTISLLLLIPIITNFLIWIRPFHLLIWSEYKIVPAGRLLTLVITRYGTWFWIFAVFAYLLVGYGAVLLIGHTFRSSIIFRRQSGWMLVGAVFPITFNLLYIFRVIPGVTEDYTTVAFAFAGLALAAGIYRYQLFTFSPLARDFLIDQIQDGFLITDKKDRVIDINPAAARIFNTTPVELLGVKIDRLLPEWKRIRSREDEVAHFSSKLEHEDDVRHFDVKTTDLSQIKRNLSGWIVILRDITERVNLLEEIQQLAILDELTQVYNRRHFYSLANNALKLAIRYYRPISLIMLDVDHFKEINDQYGHAAGDAVLKAFVSTALNTLRESDTFARLGGEEFVILLPETDHNEAIVAAERLREHIKHTPFDTGLGRIQLTISLGIASSTLINYPISLQKLIDRADQALYQAKEGGRDRVVVYNPLAPGDDFLETEPTAK